MRARNKVDEDENYDHMSRLRENIQGFLVEFLDTVSLCNLLTHDDDGFQKASDLIYKYFKVSSHNASKNDAQPNDTNNKDDNHTKCYNIRCKNINCITCAQRTLFSYFLRVYNRQCEETNEPYILTKGPEKDLVQKMKYVIYNLKHFPSYTTLASVFYATLQPFSGQSL